MSNPWFDTDEDCGYELDDPKHPTFHDRYAEDADRRRKMAKEDELFAPDPYAVDEEGLD